MRRILYFPLATTLALVCSGSLASDDPVHILILGSSTLFLFADYVYSKIARAETHPQIQRYIAEFTSEEAWSESGYLTSIGMVAMLVDERQKYAYIARHKIDPACPRSAASHRARRSPDEGPNPDQTQELL